MHSGNLHNLKVEVQQSLKRLAGLKHTLLRYGIAALCAAVAFWIRYSLTPLGGSQSPFMVFAPAALLAAHFAGLGPGLAVLVAGLALGDYFFTPPVHSWGPYGPEELTQIVTYTITTAIGVFLFQFLKWSKADAEAAAAQAMRRGEELEREIEERKRAERALAKTQAELEYRVAERTSKLQESVRSLESVLYHIAHDLRAPLRAMQGFTTMLAEEHGPQLDAIGHDYTRRVADASRRMDKLLQDLLEYGRVCQIELLPAKVELGEAVETVLKRFAGQIKDRGAKVFVAPDLPCAWADEALLQDILTHLIRNALQFVPAGTRPQISIGSESDSRMVRLWIEDNGIGIEPEQHQRIFGIFNSLNAGGSSGSGIGLAIVRKAIHRMQGDVGLESTPGQGSRFWLELPRPTMRESLPEDLGIASLREQVEIVR